MKIWNWEIIHWDCLVEMNNIPSGSVDCIITDLPYWITACEWDIIIPFDKMWEWFNRVIKDNGAIVLFGSEPFSSMLRISNIKIFKYDWIWKKWRFSNFVSIKHKPWKLHETISVFYKKKPTYNPQMTKWEPYYKKGGRIFTNNLLRTKKMVTTETNNISGDRYPVSILEYKQNNCNLINPTQKPVELIEYLIKTYTNEWQLVLDITSGSWTLWVWAQNTNRRWICIEKDEIFYNKSVERLQNNFKYINSRLL